MTTSLEKKAKCKPFLKWAGGKQKIISRLLSYLPKDFQERRYREPFLGAGSLFFSTQPKRANLSDANEHLIRCFQSVKENPKLVNKYLREHDKKNGKRYYYKIRNIYNNSKFSIAQSARFIYLNRACFNGIFRVNLSGKFNVPYGKHDNLNLPSNQKLKIISDVLQPTELKVSTFESALKNVCEGDFVYLDPPYPPLNGTSYFTHYTKDKFGIDDQKKVAEIAKVLDSRNCLFMISNADTPYIRKLYARFKITSLSVTRCISTKKKKHRVSELVITNYNI